MKPFDNRPNKDPSQDPPREPGQRPEPNPADEAGISGEEEPKEDDSPKE